MNGVRLAETKPPRLPPMFISPLLRPAERDEQRLFFTGDSFTMAGIDDYCVGNRNLLGRDVAFDYCIGLVDKLRPVQMFNPHVDEAFSETVQLTEGVAWQTKRTVVVFWLGAYWERPEWTRHTAALRKIPYRLRFRMGLHRPLRARRKSPRPET